MTAQETNLLLQWYDVSARSLPWRVRPQDRAMGVRPNPYAVWLSEIMAQQTQIVTVIPYFERFLSLWPCVEDLAAAELDSVLQAWAGLGYYARARNLHKAAQYLTESGFPKNAQDWLAVPGVGAYTSAAISAILYDEPIAGVDGNVERVMARYYAIETPLPNAKPEIYAAADALTPAARSGDYAQAVMDLGATICTPRNPQCILCPWRENCAARKQGIEHQLPKKIPKPKKPKRYGFVYILVNEAEEVLLIRRPETGLLAKMMAFPSNDWGEEMPNFGAGIPKSFADMAVWTHIGEIRHSFTHFHLTLQAYTRFITVEEQAELETLFGVKFFSHTEINQQSLPSLMRKVWQLYVTIIAKAL